VYAIGFVAVPIASVLADRAVAGHPLLVDGWRWLAIAGLGGMVAAHYAWHELPESPRWLVAKGRDAQADAVVTAVEAAVESETGRRLARPRLDVDRSGRRLAGMFRTGYRRRTLLLWTITGLRAAGFYGFAVLAPAELMSKGYSVVESLAFATASCLAYPIGAGLAAGVLDRFDRKNVLPLAAIATAVLGLIFGSAADSALIVVSGLLLSLALALLITGCHAYQVEIVPTPARGASLGLAYAIGCLVAAALAFPTDWLVANAGPSSMFTVTAVAVLALGGAVWNLGPSTTGQPLERASRPTRG
jgi:putative MFS transporter